MRRLAFAWFALLSACVPVDPPYGYHDASLDVDAEVDGSSDASLDDASDDGGPCTCTWSSPCCDGCHGDTRVICSTWITATGVCSAASIPMSEMATNYVHSTYCAYDATCTGVEEDSTTLTVCSYPQTCVIEAD